MRVTLIIPPSGFLLDERVFPSLGVLKVAAVLESHGVGVKVIDLSGVSDELHEIDRYLSTMADNEWPQIIGITATMPQMPSAARICSRLRGRMGFTPADRRPVFVLGGPHVTLLNASAKQEAKRGIDGRASLGMRELHEIFDVLVSGDGEHAIMQLITGMRLGVRIPKLIDADDPSGPLFLTKSNLNQMPIASRHLIDLNSYHYEIDGYRTHSMIGQLGCPMGCAFCGGRRSPFLRRVRTRSTENVVAEVRHLYLQYGARGIMFLDDELNVNKQFLDLLAQLRGLQSELGVDMKFRGLLKSELLTDEMAASMAATGFKQILVGFESGDPRILLNMRKNATRDENTRCVELLHKHGIKVKALMSVGHAGESEASIEETRKWLLEVRPDDFDVTIITVYPGTPYYDDAEPVPVGNGIPGRYERSADFMVPRDGAYNYLDIYTYTDSKNGDRLHAVSVNHLTDVNFYKGIPGEYQSFVWTDHLSRKELVHLRDNVEDDVRRKLGIPYPAGPSAKQYEHSMGLR